MELITIASKPLGVKKVCFFEEKKVLNVKILSTHYKYVLVFYFYKITEVSQDKKQLSSCK